MPKLIIPNVHELYRSPNAQITQAYAHSRYAYNLRFLWLMQPGDAIILPGFPAHGFMDYLADLLQIDVRTLNIFLWEDSIDAEFDAAISNPQLVQKLSQYIGDQGQQWTIQTCYFNKSIKQLAHHLGIEIDPKYDRLTGSRGIERLNCKSEFRRMASQNKVPIPTGYIVQSERELFEAIKTLMANCDQLIIKEDLDGGGRGNTVVSKNANALYCGASRTVILSDDIDSIAANIWHDRTGIGPLVVEVYCQNDGTFTTNIYIPENGGKPQLLQYSQIRFDNIWIGVEVPALALSTAQHEQLITHSLKLAEHIQSTGYIGFICCDAISTEAGLLFTEINVRPGAETHSHFLANHLFGQDYLSNGLIRTRRAIKIEHPFNGLLDVLDSNGLLLKAEKTEGVAILTFDESYTKEAEILVAAADSERAEFLEEQVLSLAKGGFPVRTLVSPPR